MHCICLCHTITSPQHLILFTSSKENMGWFLTSVTWVAHGGTVFLAFAAGKGFGALGACRRLRRSTAWIHRSHPPSDLEASAPSVQPSGAAHLAWVKSDALQCAMMQIIWRTILNNMFPANVSCSCGKGKENSLDPGRSAGPVGVSLLSCKNLGDLDSLVSQHFDILMQRNKKFEDRQQMQILPEHPLRPMPQNISSRSKVQHSSTVKK